MTRAPAGPARGRLALAAALAITAVVAAAALLTRGDDDGRSRPFLEPRVGAVGKPSAGRPNIVLLMTDDQAVGTMAAMPTVRRLLQRRGTGFSNSYVSTSLCCPSRATLFTGQLTHNHGILGTKVPPDRAQYAAMRERMASDTLPLWLKQAGYETAHVGKWLHGYGDYERNDPPPPGWDEWRVPLGFRSYYDFTDFTLSENGERVRYEGDDDYQSDVFTNAALEFIAANADGPDPFFLSVAYVAPHNGDGGSERCESGAQPAVRHEEEFSDAELPEPPNFNEDDVSDKPEKVRRLPALTEEAIDTLRVRYQCQLEALQAVDEGVREIHEVLARTKALRNTVIIYTSDNGFMQGEHRFSSSKLFPYLEALRVPLVLAGPGIPKGRTVDDPVLNVDLPATILDLAGASDRPRTALDGRSFLPTLRGRPAPPRDILFEAYFQNKQTNQRVKRVFSSVLRGDLMYTEWWTDEVELYDLGADPAQLESRHDDDAYAEQRGALAAALRDLRRCRGTRASPEPPRSPCDPLPAGRSGQP